MKRMKRMQKRKRKQIKQQQIQRMQRIQQKPPMEPPRIPPILEEEMEEGGDGKQEMRSSETIPLQSTQALLLTLKYCDVAQNLQDTLSILVPLQRTQE